MEQKDTNRILVISILAILCFSLLAATFIVPQALQCSICPGVQVGNLNLNILSIGLPILITILFVVFMTRSRYSPFALTADDEWILEQIMKQGGKARKAELLKKYQKETGKTDRNFRKRIEHLENSKYIRRQGNWLEIEKDGTNRLE